MLPGRDGAEKRSARRGAETSSNELIHLDENGVGDEEAAPEMPDERGSQSMGAIASIDRSDERRRVADDVQQASTSSRRYSSTRALRSAGPSPAPT